MLPSPIETKTEPEPPTNVGGGEGTSDIGDPSLSAKKKRLSLIVGHGDYTNLIVKRYTNLIVKMPDNTSLVLSVRYVRGSITRRDTVDGSWLIFLVTASKGSLYQRGRNGQSRRGE